jgi:hypothetical protein
VVGNHAGDDDDEGAGRPADLDARTAECGNQEPGDDRRHQALARRSSTGDPQRHGQRQCDDRDGEAGKRVGAQIGEAIPLAQDGDELGGERLPQGEPSCGHFGPRPK